MHAQPDLYIFSGDNQGNGKQHYFDSELFVTVKFEKVYLSFQAFGIFDYKDPTTSTSTLCFYTSERFPHRHLKGSVLMWTECLITDSTVIAVAAYF